MQNLCGCLYVEIVIQGEVGRFIFSKEQGTIVPLNKYILP